MLGCFFTEAKTVHTVERRELLGYGRIGCVGAWSLRPRLSTLLRNVSSWGKEEFVAWLLFH